MATQMLHSMIKNPRPTRAEVTDIANAIYYRTDALMLSGETAYGKYPVEAVATMAKIAEEAEKTKLSENDIRVPMSSEDIDVTAFLSKQAVKAENKLGVKGIITDSFTGRTARNIAAYRGKSPVFALCYNEKVMRELALSYGVYPIYQEEKKTTREYLFEGIKRLINKSLISPDDLVAYLGGSYGEGGGTTFLEINKVKDVMSEYATYVLPNLGDTK